MAPSSVKRNLRQPSIDRLDSGGFHDPSNCVLVSLFANFGKNVAPVSEFLSIIDEIKHGEAL